MEEKKSEIPKAFFDFVWIGFSITGYGNRRLGDAVLSRDTLNLKLKKLAIKAGIAKRVWTHGLRHSAATRDVVNGYNEAMLRAKYGWSKQSSMPSVYTHFGDQNLKKHVLMEKGLWQPETKEAEPLSVNLLTCMFCSATNLKENEYCSKCGKPLKPEQFKELEQKAEQLEVLQEMFKQELEKKGIDLTEITKLLVAKTVVPK